MKSRIHQIALDVESSKPAEERDVSITVGSSRPIQLRVDSLSDSSARTGYMRLMKTAYSMAMNPTMPLRRFGLLIDFQRQSGVKLISGRSLSINIFPQQRQTITST